MMKVEIYGKEILKRMSGDLSGKADSYIKSSLISHGNLLTRRLRNKIASGSRTGRMYGTHRASAPGEPPASRTGKLERSFDYIANTSQMVIGSRAFSRKGAPYPAYLEDGTSKMKKRPYFINTIESHNLILRNRLERITWL